MFYDFTDQVINLLKLQICLKHFFHIIFLFQCSRNIVTSYLGHEPSNLTYDYTARVLLMRYPFDINNPLSYFAIIIVETVLLFLSATYFLCCDTLFAQTTTHATLHLQVDIC